MKSNDQAKSDLLRLAIIVGAAMVIGVYQIITCVIVTPDGAFYIRRAQELAQDPWTVAGTFPPGYPLLLLGAHGVVSLFTRSDSVMVWVYSSQAVTLLCRVLALACLFFAGKLLTDGRRSFWAVLIVTFLPYPAEYGSLVLREWPFLLFLTLGFWLLLRALRDGRWWGFGLVGLAAGFGFLIRPECAQLVIYGLVCLAIAAFGRRQMPWSRLTAAASVLAVGFALPATPYLLASGTLVPHQLRATPDDIPPAIATVGGKSASDQPLEFTVAAGALLELPIDVFDRDGDAVTVSVVAVPPGSRPVYRFRATEGGDCFLTISESEKDALAVSIAPDALDYDGIAFHAWPDANGPAPLAPVYRLWSSTYGHHFYTTSESERNTLLEEAEADAWQSEGIAFYAFAPDHRLSDARAVYRREDSSGAPHWTLDAPEPAVQDSVAWYAYAAGQAPAGLTVESVTLRWRPSADQQGQHRLNIVADDGRVQTCQPLHITVEATARGPSAARVQRECIVPAALTLSLGSVDPGRAWDALYEIGDAFGANVMYFLVVPLALGLYYYLKDEAGPCERGLTVAVIVVNIGLVFTRYVWIQPGPARRYCLALVVLAMFHVPRGGEIMAHWLKRSVDSIGRARVPDYLAERFWFFFLVALALGPMSLPKLLTPLGADKASYLKIAQWLKDNTRPEDVIAVPDVRMSFYAERRGLVYNQRVNPREADYIVTISTAGETKSPGRDWQQVHSIPRNEKRNSQIIVYKTP